MGHWHLPEWLDTWTANATFDKKPGLRWKLPRGRKRRCLRMLIVTHTAQSWMRSLALAAATDTAMAGHDMPWSSSLRVGRSGSPEAPVTSSAWRPGDSHEHERADRLKVWTLALESLPPGASESADASATSRGLQETKSLHEEITDKTGVGVGMILSAGPWHGCHWAHSILVPSTVAGVALSHEVREQIKRSSSIKL